MAKATATPNYSSSTYLPQESAADLTHWWMPEGLKTRTYRIYKVEVLSKSTSKLKFNLAGDKWLKHPNRTQEVELDVIQHVYAGLPSTALLAEPEDPKQRFALLLLSDKFISSKTHIDRKEIPSYADGDEKWPFGAGKKKTAKRAKKA